MSETDLFPEAFQQSPKLIWLQKHGLATRLHKGSWKCEDKKYAFYAGSGETEEEACIDYANKYNVPHWTLLP